MPTYEYVCDSCGHKFDMFQMMSASPLKKCPECKKLKLRRLIGSGAGVIFKGSGFYETDYRSDGYKKAADSEKSSSAPPADTPKKTETKTETTKTAKSPSSKPDKPAKPQKA